MKNVMQFLTDVRREFSKVIWPGFNELLGSTVVVLILVVAFSLYLGFLDFGFGRLAGKILSLRLWGS